jgi:hypothetical protein
LGDFTIVDFDCSLPPILSGPGSKGGKVLVEGGDLLSALIHIYSLPKGEEPIIVNSLGTIRAMARVAVRDRDWSRTFFFYLVLMTVACKARSKTVFFLLNMPSGKGTKDVLGASWVKLCRGSLDSTWILSEGGLSRLS